ncbi:MAG TPA: hypothetical protein VNB22_07325 [Pyrinomonadaceae bacterium]|nr:hypothetical protein [Pyrinomonadaceae bacterium]
MPDYKDVPSLHSTEDFQNKYQNNLWRKSYLGKKLSGLIEKQRSGIYSFSSRFSPTEFVEDFITNLKKGEALLKPIQNPKSKIQN